MARITLCMIVRDEAALLPGCLASVRGAVDEMVIVDTGSTDATRDLGRQAGARMFDFAWNDDFAAARNESLRHASGEWVLVLDADERLGPGSAARLRAALKRAQFDCGMLRMHTAARLDARVEDVVSGRDCASEVWLAPRLLRNTDGLTFVDAIHENVTPWLRRRGHGMGGTDVDIVHLGATREIVDGKGKTDRNIRMLRARLERDPGDVVAYGYLAYEYLRSGAIDDAHETTARGWECIASRTRESPSIQRLATARAHVQIRRRRYADARETIRVATRIEGDNPELSYLMAYAFEYEALDTTDPAQRADLFATACDGYRASLSFGERRFSQSVACGFDSWIRLGTVELQRGRPVEAMAAFSAALAARPDATAARLGRAEATLELGDTAAALSLIEPLLGSSPDAWTLAASAAETLGRSDELKLFVRKALTLSAKGFLEPHRRSRLRGLVAVLA